MTDEQRTIVDVVKEHLLAGRFDSVNELLSNFPLKQISPAEMAGMLQACGIYQNQLVSFEWGVRRVKEFLGVEGNEMLRAEWVPATIGIDKAWAHSSKDEQTAFNPSYSGSTPDAPLRPG